MFIFTIGSSGEFFLHLVSRWAHFKLHATFRSTMFYCNRFQYLIINFLINIYIYIYIHTHKYVSLKGWQKGIITYSTITCQTSMKDLPKKKGKFHRT